MALEQTRASAPSAWWMLFAVVILGIPIYAMTRDSDMSFVEALPTLNATLNATSAVLLFAGWRAIKARRIALHWKLMLSAVGTSTLFLVFYVTRFALTGAHRYPVEDWTRTVYLAVLSSHTLLAVFVPFLVARLLWLAAKKRFEQHRRLARWAFPIWAYVSVTGVIIYGMLYHLAPWLLQRGS